MFNNKLKSEIRPASWAFIKVFGGLFLTLFLMHWDIRFMFFTVTIISFAQWIFHHKTKGFKKQNEFYTLLFLNIMLTVMTILLFTKYNGKKWESPFFDKTGVVSVTPIEPNDISIEGEEN